MIDSSTFQPVTINRYDWSGEVETIQVDRSSNTMIVNLYGEDHVIKLVPESEGFAVVAQPGGFVEGQLCTVLDVSIPGEGSYFMAVSFGGADITRESSCPFTAAAQLLFNVL